MRKTLAGAVLFLSYSLVHSQDSERHLRSSFDDSLGTLARAETLTQLENLWWMHGPHDFPHRAVHAAMYSKLGGPNRDALLIGAMPSDDREMKALYDSQDTSQGQDMRVTEAYNSFYSRLADALGRNPAKLPQFLRMIHPFHFVDNADESPWLCGLASTIYKAHPRKYMTAVAQVEVDFKKEALECRNPPDAP
jgi:hypothetical protein